MKNVAIVGASGYSGEELVHLLLHHPHVHLAAVTSRQYAGQTVAQIFPKFASHPRSRSLKFTDPNTDVLARAADIVFPRPPPRRRRRIRHPAPQCRLHRHRSQRRFPPQKRRHLQGVLRPRASRPGTSSPRPSTAFPKSIATRSATPGSSPSPGCYPTSILLPTLPLLRAGLIKPSGIIADSLSGVSGAGRKADIDYLFCECNESVRAYGVPKHRHLSEIEEQLSLAAGQGHWSSSPLT
jgi:N-acetyl-gamma-glutamyl-phosphate reductase